MIKPIHYLNQKDLNFKRNVTPSFIKNVKITEKTLSSRKSGLYSKLVFQNQNQRQNQFQNKILKDPSFKQKIAPYKIRTNSNSPASRCYYTRKTSSQKKYTTTKVSLQKNKNILQNKEALHLNLKDKNGINNNRLNQITTVVTTRKQGNVNNALKYVHIPGSHLKKDKKLKERKFKNTQQYFISTNKRQLFSYHNKQNFQRYQNLGYLGKGAYASVHLAIDRTNNQKVAIKVYKKKQMDNKNVARQITILKKIKHENISKLIDVYQTSQQLFIVMQYCGANSLFKYLISKKYHRLEQSQGKILFKQIVEGISYLHKNKIVHRDIKAQNILINRHKKIKIIDFGFSLQCMCIQPVQNNLIIDSYCGTPTYMAPEIVSRCPHSPLYTDLWSMGILFYVMLQGNYPFRGDSQNDLFDKIKAGKFRYISEISEKSKQVIERFLKLQKNQRMKVEELLSLQWQDWFSGQIF